MKEKFPDLNELHTDGGYGSKENDILAKSLNIMLVLTAVRGREASVKITIEDSNENIYSVKCPTQEATVTKTKKKFKASFSYEKCKICPHLESCKLRQNKKEKERVYTFTFEDAEANKRNNNIYKIPKERRKIRANVEATMKELAKNNNHLNKLNVRGDYRTALIGIATSIGINFGRIYRYFIKKGKKKGVNSCFLHYIFFYSIKWVYIIENYLILKNIRATIDLRFEIYCK